MRPPSLQQSAGKATAPLGALFNPASIVVVGASPNRDSITGQLIRHLQDRHFSGRIHPVTTKHAEIGGLKCYESIADIPGTADLAVIAIGATRVPQALRECCAKGVQYAVIISAGFAEAGNEGRKLQEELETIRRLHGIRLVGPNCQAIVNVTDNVCVGFGPVLGAEYGLQPGPVGVITQSGGFGFAFVSMMARQGIGFSKIASTGNEADLNAADFLEYLVEDDDTRVIVAYVEGLADGRRFRDLSERALARDKPVLFWKVGRTDAGKRAASSHTGRLGGDDAIYKAVMKQASCVEIDDVQDLVDYSRAFLHGRRPAGNRVGIFSASGGAGVLMADECSNRRLEIPRLSKDSMEKLAAVAPALGSLQNPIDVMGGVYNDPGRLTRALEALGADHALDSIVIINPLRQGGKAAAIARAITDFAATTAKPVFVTWSAKPELAGDALALLAAAGVPCFDTPVRCARALAALSRYSALRRKPVSSGARVSSGACCAGALELLRSTSTPVLTEQQSKEVLACYRIPVTREAMARKGDDISSIARGLGYPVAVKVLSPDIAHKTEAGGVRVNIGSDVELAQACDEVIANARSHAPDAHIEGVVIQEMVTGGIETIVGTVNDPAFGPVVMFGLGGIYAEIMGDVAFRLAPVSAGEALEMITETKCHQLLKGARSGIVADVEALADAIAKISMLAVDLQNNVAELDINPLLVLPKGQGVKALDALITKRQEKN